MRKFLYLLIVTFTLTSCVKEKTPSSNLRPSIVPQATLMYMTGTSLSYFFNENIATASSAIAKGALGHGRFLVFRHTSSTKGKLIELERNNKGVCEEVLIKEYNDIKSLSEDAIQTVIADFKAVSPAENYNLIVSGHGTGWVLKSQNTQIKVVGKNNEVEIVDLNSIWEQDYSDLDKVTRYMGVKNDGYLDITEFKSALSETDTHFGYIIFDECFMSSIELLYDLRNACDYIVASPCEIMGAGFPYNLVIPRLYEDNGYTFNLEGVCQEYYNYYRTFSTPSGCIALTKTSELENLALCVKDINQAGLKEVDTSTLQGYERRSEHIFFDFEQYMLAASSDKSLSAKFTDQFDLAFPKSCRLHTNTFYANIGGSGYTSINYYSGVTTSAPSTMFTSDWMQTSWAIDTNSVNN